MRSNWAAHITRWNRQGIRWRELSSAELLWLFYTEVLESMKENTPGQVRRLLHNFRDWDALREWDNQQLKDKASNGGRGDG